MVSNSKLIFGAIVLFSALGFYLARGISFETDLTSYSLASKEDLKQYNKLQANFTTTSADGTVVILEKSDGWNSFESFEILAKAVSFWEEEDKVKSVSSITNVIYPRQAIVTVKRELFLDLTDQSSFENRFKNWPLYADITRKFISEDGRYAFLFIETDTEEGLSQESIVAFSRLDFSASIKPHFLQNELVQQEIERLTRKDALLLGIISTLLILATFFLMTKSLRGLLLIALMVIFNLACTLMFMLVLGIPFTIHMITVPCIVIVLSFTDIMHIFYHHRICINDGLTGDALQQQVIKSVQLPMMITSLTNMIGFSVFLILSENRYLSNFAMVSMVGVAIAYLSSRFLIIPAIIAERPMIARSSYQKLHGVHQRMIQHIQAHRMLVSGALLTLFAAIIIAVIGQFKIDSSEGELMSKASALTKANTILNEAFFGDKQAEIIIELGDRQLWTAETLLVMETLSEDVNRIFSPAYIESPSMLVKRYRRFKRNGHPKAFTLPSTVSTGLRKGLNQYADSFGGENILSKDKKTVKIAFGYRDKGLEESLVQYEEMNQILAGYKADGMDMQLTGRSLLGDRGNYSFTIKIIIGLLAGILIASLLTMVFIKSTKLSLVLIFVNLLPVLAVLALMLLVGIAVTPLTLFFLSLLAGICVDDSIYMVMQKRKGSETFHIFPIAVTSSVLAVGFIALYFSSFEWIRPFSWVFLVGIGLAFLMDLLILPAFMKAPNNRQKHG